MAIVKNHAARGSKADDEGTDAPRVSVVVPVRDEAPAIRPLVDEIHAALAGGAAYEIIYVDDGSDDTTPRELKALGAEDPRLRTVRHRRSCGQSAALATGIGMARAGVIVTLDGDGQNDPADIPRLLAVLDDAPEEERGRLLVTGLRAQRKDTWLKRFSSRLANRVRGGLLGDGTPDTGCGLKVFARQAYLDLPRFDHMHRFLPALMLMRGGRVISVPVNHRPRRHGTSNYGVFDRLWVGIVDLLGVMWLKRRSSRPEIDRANGT